MKRRTQSPGGGRRQSSRPTEKRRASQSDAECRVSVPSMRKRRSRIDGIGPVPYRKFPSCCKAVSSKKSRWRSIAMPQMFNDKTGDAATPACGSDKQPPLYADQREPVPGLLAHPHYAGSAGDLFDPCPRDARQCGDWQPQSILLPMVVPVLMKSMKRRRSIERAARGSGRRGYAIPKPRIGMLEVPSRYLCCRICHRSTCPRRTTI